MIGPTLVYAVHIFYPNMFASQTERDRDREIPPDVEGANSGRLVESEGLGGVQIWFKRRRDFSFHIIFR